jgi:hypothetical protein
MTAVLEDIDVAEVLASRDPLNTPIWDDLMATCDADTIEDIGSGWPAVITDDAAGDDEESGEQPAEQDDERTADPGEDTPAEAAPAPDPDSSVER